MFLCRLGDWPHETEAEAEKREVEIGGAKERRMGAGWRRARTVLGLNACTSAPRVPDDDDEISVRNGDMDSRPSILPTPVRDPEENTSDLLCVPMSPLRPMRSPSHVSLKRTSMRLSRVSPFDSRWQMCTPKFFSQAMLSNWIVQVQWWWIWSIVVKLWYITEEIKTDSISWRTSPILAFWPRCGNDCIFLMTSGKSGATFMHVNKRRKEGGIKAGYFCFFS
jgi:hypothetical protein